MGAEWEDHYQWEQSGRITTNGSSAPKIPTPRNIWLKCPSAVPWLHPLADLVPPPPPPPPPPPSPLPPSPHSPPPPSSLPPPTCHFHSPRVVLCV
ncbi:hypothetical protein FHG87_018284 [Trinorchestia longiramus]|nr:hypothetical protein FHG87_018284 [Trinorchestia longiramus]